MKSVRGLNINVAGAGKIVIDGKSVRASDQSRFTVPSLDERRAKRRARNKVQRASRRANR